MTPTSQQVESAIEQHYGHLTVGAHTYDQPREAAMARRIAARRILDGCKRNSRSALAALGALSMETAHETFTREEREDVCADESDSRKAIWSRNPDCAICGEAISAPHEGGRLFWLTPVRLAHVHKPNSSGSCFIDAIVTRRNPEHIKPIVSRVMQGLENGR